MHELFCHSHRSRYCNLCNDWFLLLQCFFPYFSLFLFWRKISSKFKKQQGDYSVTVHSMLFLSFLFSVVLAFCHTKADLLLCLALVLIGSPRKIRFGRSSWRVLRLLNLLRQNSPDLLALQSLLLFRKPSTPKSNAVQRCTAPLILDIGYEISSFLNNCFALFLLPPVHTPPINTFSNPKTANRFLKYCIIVHYTASVLINFGDWQG